MCTRKAPGRSRPGGTIPGILYVKGNLALKRRRYDEIVPSPYDVAAASVGEVRLYLNNADRVNVEEIRSTLGYGHAHERDRRTLTDPWEYAFGDAQHLESQGMFNMERERVVRILLSQVPENWDADLLYYAPGQASPSYHWSSTEGTLHHSQTTAE